jgi:hypothetical protein
MVYTGHQKSNDYEHLDPCIPACIPPDVYTTVRRGAGRPSTVRRGAVRCDAARNTGKFSRETLFPARLGHPPRCVRFYALPGSTLHNSSDITGYYPDIARISVVISASETEYPPPRPNIRRNIRLRDRISCP